VLNATVIPTSSYVIQGNDFKAEVFLAASDTTQRPKIYICNYDSTLNKETGEYTYNIRGAADTVPVSKNGRGIYKRKGNQLGKNRWSGLIEMKAPDGSITRKPFKHEYQVEQPNVVISPTKMNVFYLGVDNPVAISIPGISMDKISATISKGSIKPTGREFIVQPGSGITTCDVTVYAIVEGTKRNMGTTTFRVKKVPDPITKIAGLNSKIATKSELASTFGVIAKMPDDFEFELKYTVTAFTLSALVGSFTEKGDSKNQSFTDAQKRIINTLKPGSQVMITDVKAIGPGGDERTLNDLVIKIK
jgi:gliding motility-associated protein GldM